jgi:uncharacterized protein (DUF433 family)
VPILIFSVSERQLSTSLITQPIKSRHRQTFALESTASNGGTFMGIQKPVVHSDPEILGGTPVFVGTRVPFQTLLDYLEGGETLDEFLENFPTVTREQAIAALEQAKEALLAHATSA